MIFILYKLYIILLNLEISFTEKFKDDWLLVNSTGMFYFLDFLAFLKRIMNSFMVFCTILILYCTREVSR